MRLQGLTRAAVILTFLAFASQAGAYALQVVRGPDQFTASETMVQSFTYGTIGALLGLIGMTQIAVGAVWCYKAQNVARERGANWAAGWAAGGWFIPLANMVIPFLVLKDMAQAMMGRVPSYFVPWWGLWIGYSLVGIGGAIYGSIKGAALGFALATGEDAHARAQDLHETSVLFGGISLFVYVVAGLLWIRFLRDIRDAEGASAVM